MINSLTSLRGVFILFIILHHLHLYPGGGTMPVTFFFVLGGFSMTLGYKDKVLKQDYSYKQYITWRCIKFLPLHWMCLLAAIPLVLLSYNWMKIPTFFINAALLQTWIPVKSIYFSFNYVSWYLADTMFFAVVFPFLLRWIVNLTLKGLLVITVLFSIVYALVAIFLPIEMYHAILYVSPYIRLADFVLGIFLARIYSQLKSYPMIFNSQVLVLSVVILLVVQSCILPISVQMIAPVYWPLVTILILSASLFGGGQFVR